jgi:hypothetical protein
MPRTGRCGAALPSRNMVADATNLPSEIKPGEINPETEVIDLAKAKNILWTAKLGSQTYGNPVVGSGKILVGTNNESPRDPNRKRATAATSCASMRKPAPSSGS